MDFASRISVVCFAASYGVGLGAELLRFISPGKGIRWLATGAALAGLTAHSMFLIHRSTQVGRLPIDSQYDSLIFVSWLVACVYLYLLVRDRRLSGGLFVLPVAIALVGFAVLSPPPIGDEVASGANIIATTHGLCFLLGTVAVILASAVAMMYLLKYRQLRQGRLFPSLRLPSLERLDRMNEVGVFVAWPLLTVGLALGFLMQRMRLDDPKVITTIVGWLVLTVLAHYRYRPEHRGQRTAILTLIAASAVMISVVGDPLFGTEHLRPPSVEERP